MGSSKIITNSLNNELVDKINNSVSVEYLEEQLANFTGGNTSIPKLQVYPLDLIVAEEGQTEFEINLDTFDASTDTVLVQKGMMLLNPTGDYVVEGNKVILTEPTIDDQTIGIWVWKNVPLGEDGSVSGKVIADGSLPLSALEEMPSAGDVGAVPIAGNGILPNNADVSTMMDNNGWWLLAQGNTYYGLPSVLNGKALGGWCIFEVQGQSARLKMLNSSRIYECVNILTGYWNQVFLANGDVTMSGALKLTNNWGRVNASSNQAYLVSFTEQGKTENSRMLMINNSTSKDFAHALELRHWVDGKIVGDFTVHGEHNKPSGLYTGNGDATERVIDIGGIGKVLQINCGQINAFVHAGGAVVHRCSEKETIYYPASEVNFTANILTLATTGWLNFNNSTYAYQVL